MGVNHSWYLSLASAPVPISVDIVTRVEADRCRRGETGSPHDDRDDPTDSR